MSQGSHIPLEFRFLLPGGALCRWIPPGSHPDPAWIPPHHASHDPAFPADPSPNHSQKTSFFPHFPAPSLQFLPPGARTSSLSLSIPRGVPTASQIPQPRNPEGFRLPQAPLPQFPPHTPKMGWKCPKPAPGSSPQPQDVLKPGKTSPKSSQPRPNLARLVENSFLRAPSHLFYFIFFNFFFSRRSSALGGRGGGGEDLFPC